MNARPSSRRLLFASRAYRSYGARDSKTPAVAKDTAIIVPGRVRAITNTRVVTTAAEEKAANAHEQEVLAKLVQQPPRVPAMSTHPRIIWNERQNQHRKASYVGFLLFAGAIYLSLKGPDPVSQTLGYVCALMIGIGICYCCGESCRHQPREMQRRQTQTRDVAVQVDLPPAPVVTQTYRM